MPRKPIDTPPTIAQVTAEREARDAANKAEVDALMDREARNLARRRAPDWWMRTDKHSTVGGVIASPKAKPKTYSL